MPSPGDIPRQRRGVLCDLREMAGGVAGAYKRFSERFGTWLGENEEGITLFFEGVHLVATVQPEVARLWDKWKDTEWGHLLWELDFSNALGLLLLLDHRQDEAIEDVLEPALTDAVFLANIKAALASAPLSAANRRQLGAGLDSVARCDYELAVPLLIVPLEGAFWQVAQDRGLVERVKERMLFTAESGGHGGASSVEAVFEPLGVDDDFRRFLLRLVYSKTGNPFRHGHAEGGWRRSGLLLVVALVGWLDLYADTKEQSLLLHTFARHHDGLDVALEFLPPLKSVAAHRREAVEPTINLLMGVHTRSTRPRL
jgi:hypothetical protein